MPNLRLTCKLSCKKERSTSIEMEAKRKSHKWFWNQHQLLSYVIKNVKQDSETFLLKARNGDNATFTSIVDWHKHFSMFNHVHLTWHEIVQHCAAYSSKLELCRLYIVQLICTEQWIRCWNKNKLTRSPPQRWLRSTSKRSRCSPIQGSTLKCQ